MHWCTGALWGGSGPGRIAGLLDIPVSDDGQMGPIPTSQILDRLLISPHHRSQVLGPDLLLTCTHMYKVILLIDGLPGFLNVVSCFPLFSRPDDN